MAQASEELKRQIKNIAETLNNPEQWRKEYTESHDRDEDDGEPGAYEWLEDVLDIRYIVGQDLNFISAQMLVAFGGPNIWVNFDDKEVAGYWGGEQFRWSFSDELGVEDALEEMSTSRQS